MTLPILPTIKQLSIIVAVSLVIAAFFVAKVPLTPQMVLVSSLFVVIFAFPSYYAVLKLSSAKRGLLVLGVIGLYALLIETSAIKTGFPYGNFTYHDLLGSKLFDATPWTVAFAYPPILLLTYWFATQRHKAADRFKIVFSVTFDAMLIDLVLDPAAVRLGFWEWHTPGAYYGVPFVNFAGWLLSGFIGGLILLYLLPHKVPATLAISGLAILWFWAWVNLFLGQFVPAIIGFALFGVFIRHFTRRTDTIKL